MCSGDKLLEALVACAGVRLSAVATAIGVEVPDASVTAEGELGFRGTLGVSKRSRLASSRSAFVSSWTATPPRTSSAPLLRLTERYCVVFQTLRSSPSLSVTYHAE